MSFEVKVEGLDEAYRRLGELNRSIVPLMADTLLEGAELILNMARVDCPVRTGRLQASLQIFEFQPLHVKFGSKVPYAGFAEYGTSRMVGRYFFTRAVEQATLLIEEDYRRKVETLLG